MTSAALIHKPHITDYKILCVIFCLLSHVNIPTIQKTCLLPYIHNKFITNLHTPNQPPSKPITICILRKTKHIFAVPCLCGANPNIPTYPSQGGGILILNVKTRSQEILPYSSDTNRLPFKIPFTILKHIVHIKIEHSSINSYWTYFLPLTCEIWVSHITKTSKNSWRDSHSTIHFYVPPLLINSCTSPLTTLCVTKLSLTRGNTDTYPLTHLSVTDQWGNPQTIKHATI